jgi:hypothetical protein
MRVSEGTKSRKEANRVGTGIMKRRERENYYHSRSRQQNAYCLFVDSKP